MRDYDYRELKVYLQRTIAEQVKVRAKELNISEQEFIKRCVMEKLGIPETKETASTKIHV